MKRLLLVAGTRPEIIKLAPVLLHVRDVLHRTADITFCLTGQHKSMAEEAMSIFGIRPDINLDIMQPNQRLSQIAQAIFGRLPEVIDQVKPDVLMVQGDTTTAAMAALSAFYMKVPVAHVEAGLRSFDLYSPYPEECNRRVIDGLATFDFCPTEAARENLRKESVPESRIFLTGNTIVDAVRLIQERHALDNPKSIHPEIRPPFVLITAHRRESFGQGFRNLCEAIRQCAVRFLEYQFVYPVHLNPNVQQPVYEMLHGLSNVLLISPVPYLHLLTLLRNCAFVLTDSGGIQEEAPSFGKYCIVMREVTERLESVRLGISELVGTDPEKIISAVTRQMADPTPVWVGQNPYGDGQAAERISSTLQ